MTVVVVAAVLTWSTVMTVLGQLAAMFALLPSLGLLVQQLVTAFHGSDARRNTLTDSSAAVPALSEEPPR